MIKRFLCALLAAMLLPLTTGCAKPANATEVAVLSIGKADAIIISAKDHTILIDAGEDDHAEIILEYLRIKNIKALDVMIITHYDKDHVGGADGVLEGIDVGAVYDADYEGSSKQYTQYVQALKATGTPRFRVTSPLTLEIGGLTLVLMPTSLAVEDDNNQSLAVSMTDGTHSFLFAGDAEEARIDELLGQGIGPHDVLKMPHHGRYEENLNAFLEAVNPQIAVITDSDDKPASDATLALLTEHGIACYQTQAGSVIITSSQSGLTIRLDQPDAVSQY